MSGDRGDRMVAIAMAFCFAVLIVLMIKGYV